MLKYLGNDEYEVFTDSGKKLVLSNNDIVEIIKDGLKIGGIADIIECKPIAKVDEDYEMLVSENKHLAEWIKTRTGLTDEKIAAIANTGTFAVIDGSDIKEETTT